MKKWCFLLAAAIGSANGCLDSKISRAKVDAEPQKPAEQITVGDLSTVGNAQPIPVSGVGLVVGLAGNGGSAPPGIYRDMLEDYLKKKDFENVREIVESPNHALVLVSAVIPPGAKAGEMLDLHVTLPDGSKVKSLRGGHLEECQLMTFDTMQNIRQHAAAAKGQEARAGGANTLVQGHKLVTGEGMLAPPADEKLDGESDWKSAWVWSGGKCKIAHNFQVLLNPDKQRYTVSQQVSDRINEVFHGRGFDDNRVAKAKSKDTVYLNVPPLYRLNVPHFLRTMRSIPVDGRLADATYKQKWADALLEPGTAVTAALRLEALGADGMPLLKPGLESPYPIVRFAAAESLCYLGYAGSAEELGKLAEEHPALQAYCLTALASLNEASCFYKLTDLLSSPVPEVRYGAFRALREQDPKNDAVSGVKLGKTFMLHRVAPGSKPLVHITTDKRCEIVLFGEAPALVSPYSFMVGSEFSVTCKAGDPLVTVSRFSTKSGNKVEQCPATLDEVLRTLAKLGGGYTDALHLLKLADKMKCLNCDLAVNALPRALGVQQLAELGKTDPTFQKELEMLTGTESLVDTPNFFQGNR